MGEEEKISYAVPDADSFNENDATVKTDVTSKEKTHFVYYENRKGFQPNVFGDELIEDLHVIQYHNQLYVYNNGYYSADHFTIENAMIDRYPSIRQNVRNEVLSYIRIRSDIKDEIEPEPYIITAKNIRINLETDELIQFSPDFLEFNKLPVTYDPNAKCEAVDRLLFNVFQGHQKLIDLFIECLGVTIIKRADVQKAVLFVGDGPNGKSTILEMLEAFLGKDNYTTVPLERLGNQFMTAELDHKLANIGDDIEYTVSSKKTEFLKNLIDGKSVTVKKKRQKPFSMKQYATHFYCCCDIPSSFKHSDGFAQWCSVIPFNAQFRPSDPDFDPSIVEKVTTPEALSYLLNLAINGAKTIITRGRMDAPEDFGTLTNDSKNSNTTVMQWIDDENLNQEFFLNLPMSEYYELYAQWCDDSGVSQAGIYSKIAFYAELRNEFGFDKNPWQRHDGKRYFKIRQ